MALVELPPGEDASAELVDRVRAAFAARTPLRTVGGDTKQFYGRAVTGEVLSIARHRGVLRYDPAELVITARGGTPLAEIETLLARHGQRLPFEPPAFGAAATIGGTVAAGIAGPGRAVHGPVRDYVLGVKLLTGDGRVLRFGGEVMKNVAGYDVSRLLAGSLGILGVLLEVSLKVLPTAVGSTTLRRVIDAGATLDLLTSTTRRGLPLTATFWCDGVLYVRLDGSVEGLANIAPLVGGDTVAPEAATAFWRSVREQQHPFFAGAGPLWRLSLRQPRAAKDIAAADMAFEWHGRQVWVAGTDRLAIEATARTVAADATLFRRSLDADAPVDAAGEVFPPLPPALMELHRAVKRVFDPAGTLNPGRMYADL